MKVGEMAGRAGYAMPSVALVECEEGEECIATRVDDSGGLVLAFHQGFEKRYPPAVADFLIAQELVQTNLGVYRQLRWIRVWRTVFAMVLGLSAALIGAMLLEPLWRAFVVAMGIAYVLMTGVNLVLSAIWSRWATRRADRRLVEVLGKRQVVEALEWYAAGARPSVLRYLRRGAPPRPRERLRWLRGTP